MRLPRALAGAVRIGLTHQTFTKNVGSVTLSSFSLEEVGARAADTAEQADASFVNQASGGLGGGGCERGG